MNADGGTITWYLTANDTDFQVVTTRVREEARRTGRSVDRDINDGTKGANKGLREFRTEMAQTASLVRNFGVAMRGFNMTSIVVAAIAAGGAVTELAGALAAAGQVALAAPGIIAPVVGAFGTLQVAVSGLGKAFGDVGNEKLFQKDLEKLTPTARDVALAFKDIYDQFVPIQEEIQKALFKDLGTQMKEVATVILPVLKDGMVETAKAMNGLALEAARVAKEPFFQRLISDTLNTTAQATNTLTKAVEPLALATAGLIEVGLPYTNMLAEWVVKQSQLFAAYVQSTKGQDELTNAINVGIKALETLGSLIGSTVGLLVTIFETSSQAGVSLIQTLSGIIDEMNAWLKTVEGQREFVALMNLTNQVITTLANVVGAALGVLFDLIQAFNELPSFIQSAVITTLAFIAVLTPVITYVSAMGGSLNTVIQIFDDFGGPVLTAVAALGSLLFILGDTSVAAQQFQQLFANIPNVVKGFADALPGAIQQLGTFVSTIVDTILKGLPLLLNVGIQVVLELVSGILAAIPQLVTTVSNILIQLVNTIVAAVPLIFNAAITLVQGIIDAVITNTPKIVDSIIVAIQALINAIITAIPQLVTATVTFIDELVKTIIKSLPSLIDGGIKIIQSVVDGIVKALPVVVDAITKLIPQLVSVLLREIPNLINAGVQIIVALINGITQALPSILTAATQIITGLFEQLIKFLPTLIPAAVQIIMTLVNAIIAALPLLITAAVQLVQGLVNGIIQNLPEIINATVILITTLIKAIVDNLPLIVNAAVLIITALTTAIIDNLPLIIDAVVEITLAILNAIIDNLPMIIDAGLQIILALAESLVGNLGQIIGAIGNLMNAIISGINSFLGSILSAGLQIVLRIAAGMIQAIPNILIAVASIIGNIVLQLSDSLSKFVVAGANIIGGLINGINGAKNQVIKTITDIASGALNAIKKFFGIHSPSRVMRDEVGKMLGLGIAGGIADSTKDAVNAASSAASSITDAFSLGTTSADFAVNTTQTFARQLAPSVLDNGSSTVAGSGVTINQTNQVYTDIDMDQVNRNLTWELGKL